MLDTKKQIESLLGDRSKIKIILYLDRVIESNITRIARSTGLHYRTVAKHLEELKSMGIVEEKRVGRIRIFSLNYDNPLVITLIGFIRVFE